MQFILHKCWVTTSKGGKAARQLEFLWLWAHLSVLMHRWSSIQRATAPMVSQACFSNMKETRTNMQQLWRNKHNITCATSKLDHPPRSPCQLSASCVCFYHLTVHFLLRNGRLNNWVIFPPTHTHTHFPWVQSATSLICGNMVIVVVFLLLLFCFFRSVSL